MEKTRYLKPIPFIPRVALKGAYKALADALKLTHVKDDVYADEKGTNFVLTKRGFMPAVMHHNIEYTKQLERDIKDFESGGAVEEHKKLQVKYNSLIVERENLASKNRKLKTENIRLLDMVSCYEMQVQV